MVRDYDVRAELDSVAKQIHDYDPNPITWMSWMKYLLIKLEEQSKDQDAANQQRYVEMIAQLRDAIYGRQQTGGW
jgi:hypothetical protein